MHSEIQLSAKSTLKKILQTLLLAATAWLYACQCSVEQQRFDQAMTEKCAQKAAEMKQNIPGSKGAMGHWNRSKHACFVWLETPVSEEIPMASKDTRSYYAVQDRIGDARNMTTEPMGMSRKTRLWIDSKSTWKKRTLTFDI